MKIQLNYDKGKAGFEINEENVVGVLEPNLVEHALSGANEVVRALREPIHSKCLKDIVRPGEQIVIITSDITRPMPTKLVIPEVLKELYEAGVTDQNIKIIFALGIHRKHSVEDQKYLVGEDVYHKIECLDSDIDEVQLMGYTSRGTPVEVFKPVADADRVICLGNIEYHYFAGYSGGAKALLPGVSSHQTIQANHSRMINEFAKSGNIKNNPIRNDIEEAVKFVQIDFILNVILDDHKNIIKAVAGDYIEAHREGCRFLDQLYKVAIKEKADIVIASPGGFPKDINLYQAQKALDNAKDAVKDGGVIILVGSCKEGFGERTFERWIRGMDTPDEIIAGIQKNFELGGHKAAAIALVSKKCDIFLVSDLEEAVVKDIFMKPYSNAQTALNEAFNKLGCQSKVIIMPNGGSTLPYYIGD